ncbi:uncharacterized protein LOC106639106 [Copidosoma floridanum]|uniref:uncharacterized protein LOC106639106 n=1 Tax=Copidosoma floridanum TaxID=29053 RepID=UPI0006C9835E|nr:uncharacterized protein LOC106639106 [Copidosoma floridanum]
MGYFRKLVEHCSVAAMQMNGKCTRALVLNKCVKKYLKAEVGTASTTTTMSSTLETSTEMETSKSMETSTSEGTSGAAIETSASTEEEISTSEQLVPDSGTKTTTPVIPITTTTAVLSTTESMEI